MKMKMQHRIVVRVIVWWYLAMKPSLALSCAGTSTCSKVFTTRDELNAAITNYTGPNGPNGDINQWCFPTITDLSNLLYGRSTFNYDIGCWDVSRVTKMDGIFGYATAFNQNIDSWNVSRVTGMSYVFFHAIAFNHNIGSWDVTRVTDMTSMFAYAAAFNQNIGPWNVSRVTNMENMFFGAIAFNENIGSWDVSSVTDMYAMFYNAAVFNKNIGSWNVSRVTDMENMFFNAAAFNQNLCSWGTIMMPTVTTFYMFVGTSCANQSSPVLTAKPVEPLCAQVCNLSPTNPTKTPMQAPVPVTPVLVPLPVAKAPVPVRLPTNVPPSKRTIDIYPGDSIVQILNSAQSGDTIIVHQGDYLTSDTINISVDGTESSPVVIRSAFGEARPRIVRSSTATVQSTINIVGATYLTIQGLEILSNGGGDGIKVATGDGTRNNQFIFLDDLVLHQVSVGINAQSNVDQIFIRKSHIYDTSNGPGLILGCRDGTCIVTNSVIEGNWINDTRSTVSDQGNGIELNQNSYENIIRNNVIYNTDSAGILVFGAGSGTPNKIEGNVMWNCKEGGIQAVADAIIQNNLVFNSDYGLISSAKNSVNPKNLKIVHNTFVRNLVCLDIQSWNGQSDIIFANNAAYCKTDTMNIQGGTQNVQISGNVFFPKAGAFPSGSYVLGDGFTQDFETGDFNAYPTRNSRLRTAANALYQAALDFEETLRLNKLPVEAGAYEWQASGRKWIVSAGFKPDGIVDGNTPAPIINRPVESPTQSPTLAPTPIRRPLVCRIIFFRLFLSRRCR